MSENKENEQKSEQKKDLLKDFEKETKLRYPSSKLALLVELLAEKEEIPFVISPVDEYNFVILIPYEKLAKSLFDSIYRKYPNVVIESSRNKILFYIAQDIRTLIIQDIHDIVDKIYNKFNVKIGINIPSDNELIIIANAEPLALRMVQILLKKIKEKNNDVQRLFRFKKGEFDVPEVGYSMVVGVEYTLKHQDKLEDLVSKL